MNTNKRSSAVYVYGLVRARFELDLGAIGIDEEGSPAVVYKLSAGSVAALVSARKDRSSVLPVRRDLDAHQRVLSRVLEAGTILPFAFGQVARNERPVMRLLRDHEAAISEELDRLEGKVQMGLKVHWDVDNIYRTIIDSDPELAALRERVFASPDPSMADKIELGARFDESLQIRRATLIESLTAALGSALAPPEELPVRDETAIADLMILIERGDRARFEEEVRRLADTWPDEYAFRVTGPWAPFNFVELELPGSADGGRTWAS